MRATSAVCGEIYKLVWDFWVINMSSFWFIFFSTYDDDDSVCVYMKYEVMEEILYMYLALL